MALGIVIVVEVLKNSLNTNAYIHSKWIVLAVGLLGAASQYIGFRELDFNQFVGTLAMALFIYNFLVKPCLNVYRKRHPLG